MIEPLSESKAAADVLARLSDDHKQALMVALKHSGPKDARFTPVGPAAHDKVLEMVSLGVLSKVKSWPDFVYALTDLGVAVCALLKQKEMKKEEQPDTFDAVTARTFEGLTHGQKRVLYINPRLNVAGMSILAEDLDRLTTCQSMLELGLLSQGEHDQHFLLTDLGVAVSKLVTADNAGAAASKMADIGITEEQRCAFILAKALNSLPYFFVVTDDMHRICDSLERIGLVERTSGEGVMFKLTERGEAVSKLVNATGLRSELRSVFRATWEAPYVSNRGFPLVFQGEPPSKGQLPILTIENYPKWYAVFAVQHDGSVVEVSMGGDAWSDHIPIPQHCADFAEANGYEWDECSLDMICGRYAREVQVPLWAAL